MNSRCSAESLLLAESQEILLLIEPSTLAIHAANASAMQQLGYNEQDLLGRAITDIECALTDVFFWEEVRSGAAVEASDVEGLYQCADGNTLTVLKSVKRIASDPPWIVVRARNIDEQKNAEEALARMASQLRATLEATVDGILMLDREGNVVNINRRFAQLWQLPDELLLRHDDKRLFDFIASHVADESHFRERVANLSPTSDGESFDTLKLKDERIFECKSRPARSSEQIIGRVFCFTDVTERHRAELALISARDEAKAASRAKSEFLAMMSHEIRTPMNGIMGMAQLLEESALGEEQKTYTQTIRRSSEALLEIINDILDYSKIEARKLNLENVPFNLAHLIGDVEKLFAVKQKESGLLFSCHCDADVPTLVKGDPVRVRQLLVNLIGNAFKFTHEGSIALNVSRLPHEGETSLLRFAVRDTGIGIPADKIGSIFTPFEQADMSTSRRYGGTGLGLSICRMLCQMMQGEIGVNSELGKGSEFWFTVQLQQPQSSQAAPNGVQTHEAIAFLTEGTRVLIVEDNPVNLMVLTKLLRRIGAQDIVSAGNGREGVSACEKADFDVIFMDIRMPEMDGLEATQTLRKNGLKTYILGLSADAMQEDRERALAAGMNDYLTKPISIEALRAGIERWQQFLTQ